MKQVAIIDVVGLTKGLLGKDTPFLTEWAKQKTVSSIEPVLPAVTCSVQSTYLTGKWPNEHGIVANGWYFRDEGEVKLWRQSNKLVQSKKVWDYAKERDKNFTCANMFWWYNMNSTVDISVTPRPQYLADGRKIPDCYSSPSNLRDRLQEELGTFPLFDFWGPKTSIKSSAWIANASKKVHDWHNPTLMLIYLPHMDYSLQKYGPEHADVEKDLNEIDKVCEDLILFLEKKGVEVNVLSEYGITKVEHPIHINRILREMDLILVRDERGLEILDVGACKVFAMADHQVAHVYFNDVEKISFVKEKLEKVPGVEMVLDKEGQNKYHLDHERSGELVVVADENSWFTFYYWMDDKKAPDFARTVDIHNKPGYDPVELFLDPEKKFVLPRVGYKLLKKKLGFRTLMDVIPLDANLVKGSHGRVNINDSEKAIFIGGRTAKENLSPTSICDTIMTQIFE